MLNVPSQVAIIVLRVMYSKRFSYSRVHTELVILGQVDWPRSGYEHSEQCSNPNLNLMFGFMFSHQGEPEPHWRFGFSASPNTNIVFEPEPNIFTKKNC